MSDSLLKKRLFLLILTALLASPLPLLAQDKNGQEMNFVGEADCAAIAKAFIADCEKPYVDWIPDCFKLGDVCSQSCSFFNFPCWWKCNDIRNNCIAQGTTQVPLGMKECAKKGLELFNRCMAGK